MSKNLEQVYSANPSTTLGNNDLVYSVQQPANSDTAIKYSDLRTELYSNINVPNTTNTGTGGVQFNSVNFVSNYGTNNTFVGQISGNTSLTTGSAVANTALGYNAAHAITTAADTTAIGAACGQSITTGISNCLGGQASGSSLTDGASNTMWGTGAGANIVHGSVNTLLGLNAGSHYTGSESYNIIVGPNLGTAAESHVIRIGDGSGTNFTSCFIDGIAGVTVSSKNVVTINSSTFQLGSDAVTGNIVSTGTVSAFSAQQYFAQASLTDSSPITWNLTTQQTAYVLLTAAVGATRQLQNPTNMHAGATYTLIVQQSSTGSNALTYGTVYKFPGGAKPILSTANNAIDILTFISDGTSMYGVAQYTFA